MSVGDKQGRNLDIQILRAYAVGLVLLQHLSATPTVAMTIMPNFTLPFYLGVELFFVISGYVVTGSLFHNQADGRQSTTTGFLVRRAFRLYPAMLGFFAFSYFAYQVTRTQVQPGTAMDEMFFFDPGFFLQQMRFIMTGVFINKTLDHSFYSNGAMWSLSVEFQFYFAFAIVWLICSIRWLQPHRKLVIFVVSLALLSICVKTRLQLAFSGVAPTQNWLIYLLNYKFDFMMSGVAMACIKNSRRYREKKASSEKSLSTPFFAGLVIVIPLWLTSHATSPLQGMTGYPVREGLMMTICLCCFSALIWWAADGGIFSFRQGRIYKTLAWLGDISYGMYLFHIPVMMLVWAGWTYWAPSFVYSPIHYGIFQFLAVVALTIMISAASYIIVEKKANAFGRKLSNMIERRG